MSQSDSFKEIVPLVLTGLNHFASYPCVFLLLFSNINDTFKKKSDFTQIYCPNFVYFFFVLAQNIFSNFEVSLLLNFYIWNLNICAQKKHAISLDSGCAVGYYNVVASRHQLTLSYFCSITVSIVPTHSSQETHLDFASDFVIIGRDSPEFALR